VAEEVEEVPERVPPDVLPVPNCGVTITVIDVGTGMLAAVTSIGTGFVTPEGRATSGCNIKLPPGVGETAIPPTEKIVRAGIPSGFTSPGTPNEETVPPEDPEKVTTKASMRILPTLPETPDVPPLAVTEAVDGPVMVLAIRRIAPPLPTPPAQVKELPEFVPPFPPSAVMLPFTAMAPEDAIRMAPPPPPPAPPRLWEL
jgi:hypothetical protein